MRLATWLARIAPAARERTRRVFGFDGIHVSSATVPDGSPIPSWGTVNFWPGAATWLGHHFRLHWLYTRDVTYLREKAYPYLRGCMEFWEQFLEAGDDGRLHVPLSHSPEWRGNDVSAWGRDTTIDLSLARNLATWVIEASEVLEVDAEARERWRSIWERIAPYPVDASGSLMLMEGVGYDETHRHPSHMLPIHPMGDLTIEGSDEERRIVERSIGRWESLGFGEWTGWSFPWASLIASRTGKPEMAAYMLRLYLDSFVYPNGFHVNGDWRGRGVTRYHYHPYTMEAECAAVSALTEMLLQSWGGKIRLFPALPVSWRDASFTTLRSEGGVLVSAERRNRRVVSAELVSETGRLVTVVGCDTEGAWSGANAFRDGDAWRVELAPGTTAVWSMSGKVPGDPLHRHGRANIFGFHGWENA